MNQAQHHQRSSDKMVISLRHGDHCTWCNVGGAANLRKFDLTVCWKSISPTCSPPLSIQPTCVGRVHVRRFKKHISDDISCVVLQVWVGSFECPCVSTGQLEYYQNLINEKKKSTIPTFSCNDPICARRLHPPYMNANLIHWCWSTCSAVVRSSDTTMPSLSTSVRGANESMIVCHTTPIQ